MKMNLIQSHCRQLLLLGYKIFHFEYIFIYSSSSSSSSYYYSSSEDFFLNTTKCLFHSDLFIAILIFLLLRALSRRVEGDTKFVVYMSLLALLVEEMYLLQICIRKTVDGLVGSHANKQICELELPLANHFADLPWLTR